MSRRYSNDEDYSKKKDYSKGLIRYSSRDYPALRSEFFDMVSKLTELWDPKEKDKVWKPESAADPGVVLGTWLASVADILGMNTDILANELFAPSVNQRKNAEKIFALIGYELGWYTAARTEVTFTNGSDHAIDLDFGFSGESFATLNAYTDITDTSRVITYNILPLTNGYGDKDTRSRRQLISDNINVFAESDPVTLEPGKSVTRLAIEGELRSQPVSVADVKANNYIINLPSQNIDTSAVWLKAKASQTDDTYMHHQWIQVSNNAEFLVPEPRFAVTYDLYSNAQIQVSNYLDQLEDYANCWLVVYWIDCSGTIGCVGKDVLSNFLPAVISEKSNQSEELENIAISNLSNTTELPHTYAVTGQSPETAKEAYHNSRNYINTYDSLVTLPDYNRFLKREPGVDCGVVIDCQKAVELNLAVYNDENLTDAQKSKMYITHEDFPSGSITYNWQSALDLDFNPEDPLNSIFAANFKNYTAMCFAIHNDFQPSFWGQSQKGVAQIKNEIKFKRYKPPVQFIEGVKEDYRPLQAMSVDIDFGYARIFEFYVVGTIFPKRPVSKDVGNTLIAKAKEALALYFAPANREMGQAPTIMEIVNIIENCDDRIEYVDLGSKGYLPINWYECDPEYFNYISFAKMIEPPTTSPNLRIAPSYILRNS